MLRVFAPDRRIVLLVSALVLIALSILYFKVHVLKFTLLPSPETELWLLECRVKFETPGGPVRASISMPEEVPGYFLTGVSTTPGFRFDSEERDGRLIANWSGTADGGTHTILYQMRLIPDRHAGRIADPIEPVRKPVWSDGITAAAAEAFLKQLDPGGRAKPEVLIPRVLKELHNRNLPSVRTLLPKNRQGAHFVRIAGKLLAMRGIPSRLVEGIYLVDGRRRQMLSAQLEAFYGNRIHRFDPLTGKLRTADGFLPLRNGDTSLLEIQGVRNPKFHISVLKTSVTAANLNQLRGSLVRHSWILDLSGFNLPLEEQNLFKQIAMLPLAILVIVIIRNLIGLQTMGTFMPVLISLAFLDTGLTAGIISFVLIISIGLLIRSCLTKLNLLMVPRISAVVILVILLMKIMSVIAYTFGFMHGQAVTYFPLIILAWTIERSSMIWEEDGPRVAVRQLLVSLLACLPCYLLMSNATLQCFFFSFPEMNLIVLALILLIGVYTGYRLTELKRFRPLVLPCSEKF